MNLCVNEMYERSECRKYASDKQNTRENICLGVLEWEIKPSKSEIGQKKNKKRSDSHLIKIYNYK